MEPGYEAKLLCGQGPSPRHFCAALPPRGETGPFRDGEHIASCTVSGISSIAVWRNLQNFNVRREKASSRQRGDRMDQNGWTGEWSTFLRLTSMLSQNIDLLRDGAFTWSNRLFIAQNFSLASFYLILTQARNNFLPQSRHWYIFYQAHHWEWSLVKLHVSTQRCTLKRVCNPSMA